MSKKKTPSKKEQELLEALRSKDVYVRLAAARYRHATPEVLLRALKDRAKEVRRTAAYNRKATPEILLIAMKDEHKWVRWNAAANLNATPEVLLLAMKDKDKDVRCEAAGNPKIKSLNLSTDKWLELVAEGFFEGSLKNIPPHVKKDPRYKSIRLLSKLANP